MVAPPESRRAGMLTHWQRRGRRDPSCFRFFHDLQFGSCLAPSRAECERCYEALGIRYFPVLRSVADGIFTGFPDGRPGHDVR